jgi:hypothetical protein
MTGKDEKHSGDKDNLLSTPTETHKEKADERYGDARPRPHVMSAYRSSLERFRLIYEKLASKSCPP